MSAASILLGMAALPQPPTPIAPPPPSPEVFMLMTVLLMAASGLLMWMCGYEFGRRAPKKSEKSFPRPLAKANGICYTIHRSPRRGPR